MDKIYSLKITTLAPFNYGHLMVSGGVATVPDIINDKAIMFSLASALGIMSRSSFLPEKDYKKHILSMPWRSSLFMCRTPKLMRPIARRSDLGIEAGYQDRVRRAAASGNFKEYFSIQEVPPYQEYFGLLISEVDIFDLAGSEKLALRVGSNRTGIVQMERCELDDDVHINVSTAKMFDRTIGVQRVILDQMAVSVPMSIAGAAEEMASWR